MTSVHLLPTYIIKHIEHIVVSFGHVRGLVGRFAQDTISLQEDTFVHSVSSVLSTS